MYRQTYISRLAQAYGQTHAEGSKQRIELTPEWRDKIFAFQIEQKDEIGFAVCERVLFVPRGEWHRVVRIDCVVHRYPILSTYTVGSVLNGDGPKDYHTFSHYITTLAEDAICDEHLTGLTRYKLSDAKSLYVGTGEFILEDAFPAMYNTMNHDFRRRDYR